MRRRSQWTHPQEGTPLPTTTKQQLQRDADNDDFDDEYPKPGKAAKIRDAAANDYNIYPTTTTKR